MMVEKKLHEKIAEKPDKYSALLDEIFAAGFTVVGEKYKKDNYPEIPECFAKEILNCRGFYIEKTVPVGENVFSSALADELSDGFIKLNGFFELLEVLS